MSFFRRSEIIVRCTCRGTVLAAPDRDALLDACEPGQRRRLQHCLAAAPDAVPAWSVQWGKSAGEALRPHDIVAVLRRAGVAVELVYEQRGSLAEVLVASGASVAAGTRLARVERRTRAAPGASERSTNEMLRQFVAQRRRDAQVVAALQAELAARQNDVDRLRDELAALRARGEPTERTGVDHKFKRLKHEFSKRYHPDARPQGDAERLSRERVFREFWAVVEEIERS